MINKITAETVGKELFEHFIYDWCDTTLIEPKGGTLYDVKRIHEIGTSRYPGFNRPDLVGFWESNMYEDDFNSTEDLHLERITELTRVVKKPVLVDTWVKV